MTSATVSAVEDLVTGHVATLRADLAALRASLETKLRNLELDLEELPRGPS
jgi:hypothetical protein